ncbi:MAG: hypothetical protein HEP71_03265 [Roseivirga sp.]|nr:hypothetical protein [Roseivirga sp.]
MPNIEVDVHGKYEFAIFKRQLSPATDSGTFKQSTWTPVEFTWDEYAGKTDWAVLNNRDRIRLAKGNYLIKASATAYAVGRHRLRFRDLEGNETRVVGMNAFARSEGDDIMTAAHLRGIMEVKEESDFQLQHICQRNNNGDGFGLKMGNNVANDHEDELYAILEIIRFT